jgi:hypothetical protein
MDPTKLRSILRRSKWHSRSCLRLELPVPKSSSAMRIPAAWKALSASFAAALSLTKESFADLDLQPRGAQSRLGEHLQNAQHQHRVGELHTGDVERQFDRGRPLGGIARGATQQIRGKLGDQPGVLGNGDELFRREFAEQRVLPARQGLEADDRAVGEVDDRLIMGLDAAGLDRRP